MFKCNGPRSERSRRSKSLGKQTHRTVTPNHKILDTKQPGANPSPPPKTCRCPLNINISSTTYHFIRVHSSNGVMEGKVNRFPARESKADCESAEGGGGSRNGPLTQHVSGSVSNSPSLSFSFPCRSLISPSSSSRAEDPIGRWLDSQERSRKATAYRECHKRLMEALD